TFTFSLVTLFLLFARPSLITSDKITSRRNDDTIIVCFVVSSIGSKNSTFGILFSSIGAFFIVVNSLLNSSKKFLSTANSILSEIIMSPSLLLSTPILIIAPSIFLWDNETNFSG